MSEGGSFLWKRQEIDQHRGPAGSYKYLSKALPEPPENLVWIRNPDTKEWRLEERPETDFVATAEFIGESDLIVHDVRPEDTFEGICLRYKVNPTALRQANNGFQGSNLALAPNPLIIPTTTDDNGNRRPSSQQQLVVDLDAAVDTHEQKIARLQKSCPHLSVSEAKAYLELNDWEVNQAFEAARQDGSEHDGNDPFTKAVHRQDSMKDMNNECTFLCKQFSSFLKSVMKK